MFATFPVSSDNHTGDWEYSQSNDPIGGVIKTLMLSSSDDADDANDDGALLYFCHGGLFFHSPYDYVRGQITRVRVDDSLFSVEWAATRFHMDFQKDAIYLVDYGHGIRNLLSGNSLIIEIVKHEEANFDGDSWRSVYSFSTTGWEAAVQENCN